ncbi:MAG: hypothetical protein WCX79_00990 [Candidatus Paceibacterota bacterium]|jgi:hypothetical protein
MSTENGVWFSREKILMMFRTAEKEKGLNVNNRSVVFKKIDGKIFVWVGSPTKQSQVKSGIMSLKKMGFKYIRLINGDFFVSN